MDLVNIDGMFLLKMLWVIIKATLECKMECFILRFSASWNNVFEQPFTIKLQLKVSSNFVYILFLTFTSDFWRNSSSKSALRSWFRKNELSKSKTSPLRDKISLIRIYSFIQKLTNLLILEYSFRVSSWKPSNYSQNNKMGLF